MKQLSSVIVFDRENSTLEDVKQALAEAQWEITPCASEEALPSIVESSPVEVLVINLEKPFEGSFRLLSEIQTKAQEAQVIFVAPFDDDMRWVWMEVIQRGAYEFLPKPFEPEELRHHLIQASKKYHSRSLRKLRAAGFLNDLNRASLHKTTRAGA